MATNKIIYGGNVLIDLTNDTVTPETLLKGQTAHHANGEIITGTCTFDANTQDANATQAEILKDKTAYVRGQKLVGSMPNNGAVSGVISEKDTPYQVPAGFHDGSGVVSIDENSKNALKPDNIREGVNVLGVIGTMSGSEDIKAQSLTVVPKINEQVVLPEEGFNYLTQVTIAAIPYSEADNSAGGITVTIAGTE